MQRVRAIGVACKTDPPTRTAQKTHPQESQGFPPSKPMDGIRRQVAVVAVVVVVQTTLDPKRHLPTTTRCSAQPSCQRRRRGARERNRAATMFPAASRHAPKACLAKSSTGTTGRRCWFHKRCADRLVKTRRKWETCLAYSSFP